MHHKKSCGLPADIRETPPADDQTLYPAIHNDAYPELREYIPRDSEEKTHEATRKAVRKQFRKKGKMD
jgi:cation transport regulator ChaB